jgi:hypothetical protein
MILRRTTPGRYYGHGEDHTYLAVKVHGAWELTVFTAQTVAGVEISGREVASGAHSTLALCRAVVAAFEDLGSGYSPAEHGHRSRHTEAIQIAYEETP